jgi:fatty acid desaturase
MPIEARKEATVPEVDGDQRERARKRLEAKRKLSTDVVVYVIVNAFLVLVWAISGRGYFWPGWVMAGWGVLLLLDAFKVYLRKPITESDIDEELRRHS